jgi:hypothetical protein
VHGIFNETPSVEVHVYYQPGSGEPREVGLYGSHGFFGKHGRSSDVRVLKVVENRLKGIAIDEMRRSGRLGADASIKGDDWMRPHLGEVCG